MDRSSSAPRQASRSQLDLTAGPAKAPPLGLTRRRFVAATLALLASTALPVRSDAAGLDSPGESLRIPANSLAEQRDQRLPLSKPLSRKPPKGRLVVPYHSQLDGSPQASANCGPACLSMLLSYHDDKTSIADIRYSVNVFMKAWATDNGSTWEALADAASTRGFEPAGLFERKGVYRRWSVEDLLAETEDGNPVVILAHYRALPGHEDSWFRYNHYVVVVGRDDAGSILYHDPAYADEDSGAYRTMTREQLHGAWSRVSSGIVFSGMTISPRSEKEKPEKE